MFGTRHVDAVAEVEARYSGMVTTAVENSTTVTLETGSHVVTCSASFKDVPDVDGWCGHTLQVEATSFEIQVDYARNERHCATVKAGRIVSFEASFIDLSRIPIFIIPERIAPLCEIPLTGETWVDELLKLEKDADASDWLIAAGRRVRLYKPSIEECRATVARLLAGEVEPCPLINALVRASKTVQKNLVRSVHVQLDMLYADVESFKEDLHMRQFIKEAREDLEGCVLLLHWAGIDGWQDSVAAFDTYVESQEVDWSGSSPRLDRVGDVCAVFDEWWLS
jgi:hypothetical protein